MKTRQTNNFTKKAGKLIRNDEYLKNKLYEAMDKLISNPFDKSLFTHKLKGSLENKYSSRITYDLRIIFEIIKENKEDILVLLTIGTHDEVY